MLFEFNLEKQVKQTNSVPTGNKHLSSLQQLGHDINLVYPWHFRFVFSLLPVYERLSAEAGTVRLSLSLSMLRCRPCLAVLRSAVEAAFSILSAITSRSCSSSSGCFAWRIIAEFVLGLGLGLGMYM